MGDNKIIDKIKFFWGLDNQEPEDTTEDFYKAMKRSELSTEDTMSAISETSERTLNTIKTSNKVLNIHSNAQMSVVLFQPKTFDEATAIVDTLKSKRPVVLNIVELEMDLARKIFDFCSGALYALDGHIQQVAKGIFVLAPTNVDITGDVTGKPETGIPSWLNE